MIGHEPAPSPHRRLLPLLGRPAGRRDVLLVHGNLRALHVAAQHETEMLTGELTQRMQVVTTQISERVEHLMDMPAAVSTAATGTSGKGRSSDRRARRARSSRAPPPLPLAAPPAAPAPPTAPAPPVPAVAGAIDPRTIEGQVAASLGEVAMLLNNVEVRGLGRGGGRPARRARHAARRRTRRSRIRVARRRRRGSRASRRHHPAAAGSLRSFRRRRRQLARGDGRGAGENAQARGDAPPEASGREGDGRRGRAPLRRPAPDRPPTDPAAPAGARRAAPTRRRARPNRTSIRRT